MLSGSSPKSTPPNTGPSVIPRSSPTTAAAFMNMEYIIFMGEEDVIRQALNVCKMKLLL